MVDLSRKELEVGLWCVDVVAQGYGDGGPDHDVMVSFKAKLLREPQATARKAPDIPGPVVVHNGKAWTR